jgi:hypothetical protein
MIFNRFTFVFLKILFKILDAKSIGFSINCVIKFLIISQDYLKQLGCFLRQLRRPPSHTVPRPIPSPVPNRPPSPTAPRPQPPPVPNRPPSPVSNRPPLELLIATYVYLLEIRESTCSMYLKKMN